MKPKSLISIFLIGFIVFAIIGNLLCGETAGSEGGIYSFFYQTIPAVLASVLGLPLASTAGAVFTLIAGIFFTWIAYKMYSAYRENGSWDYDGALWTFFLAFLYMTAVSTVMIEPSLAENFLSHKFLSFFPILFFIIYAVVMLSGFKKGKEFGTKRVCYLLSAIGFSMGLAALSRAILAFKLERIIVIPSKAAELFFNMAASSEAGAFTAVKFIIIQAVLAALVVAFYRTVRSGGNGMAAETMGFGILVYWSYSPLVGTNVYPQGIKYWLFLFVIAFILANEAKKSHENSKKVLVGSIGLAISVPCLYYSIVCTYSAVNASFTKILADLTPAKEKARDFVMGIFPEVEGQEMAIAGMVVVTLVIAVITLLLLLPIKGRQKLMEADDKSLLIMLSCTAFLGGVMLRSTGLVHHIILKIAYGVIVGAVILYCGSLVISLSNREKIGKHIYALVVTALLTPAYCLFAQTVGIVMAAVILAIVLLITVKNNLEAAPTKGEIRMKRIMNMADYAETIDKLNEDIANGANENDARAKARLAADAALKRDRDLKDEMDKL